MGSGKSKNTGEKSIERCMAHLFEGIGTQDYHSYPHDNKNRSKTDQNE